MDDSNNNQQEPEKYSQKRRDLIKGLASLPVLGAFAYGFSSKRNFDSKVKLNIVNELNLSSDSPLKKLQSVKGEKIRLGIIGYGGRGNHLVRSAGFASPKWIDDLLDAKSKNPRDTRFEEYKDLEDLNIELTAVCDVFDIRANEALEASGNINREGSGGKQGKKATRFRTYQELINSKTVDAVIIATPDHLHAPITIAAANAGIHVYVEKCMTRTIEETYLVYDAIRNSGIVFQLGHQGRQTESYLKAKEIIEKNILGKITLIEVCTNRNDPNGAWQYEIHKEANQNTIDWELFTGNGPIRPFSLERFFRWRCWWDYGTGLSGDLLTHEFDAMNQILNLGIPQSVVASGGIYFFKDGRDVPDVWQVALEYPKRDFTLLYSATLASERNRGKVIMGHDASLEIGENLNVFADQQSTRYKEKIEAGIIDPNIPIFSYIPGRKNMDAVTTATEAYFAGRGLLYTYIDGKRVDTTFLHIKEWIDCIRKKEQPSCDIEQGFQEAITAHMATLAYREGIKVYWDESKREVVRGEIAKPV
jgi:predicted dehydrogenase